MKIKIIDLLNLVYEKKAPKKIKWNYHVYIYDEQYDDYYEETTAFFENEMSNGMLFKSLEDYVEIIEERPKEIKELEGLPFYYYDYSKCKSKEDFRIYDNNMTKKRLDDYHNKINEIIYLLKKEDNKRC